MENVTPIFAGVPIVSAAPKASDAALAAYRPTQDWILVRPKDVFASAGLVRPEDIKSTPNEGIVLREGPDAFDHFTPDCEELTDARVQWRQQAHFEPVKIDGELLLLVRARDVIAVLAS